MPKTIHLRVKKELEGAELQKVLKFKGALIKGSFTEIIHIADEDQQHHLNFFTAATQDKKQTEDFVKHYIAQNNLEGVVTLLKAFPKPHCTGTESVMPKAVPR